MQRTGVLVVLVASTSSTSSNSTSSTWQGVPMKHINEEADKNKNNRTFVLFIE